MPLRGILAIGKDSTQGRCGGCIVFPRIPGDKVYWLTGKRAQHRKKLNGKKCNGKNRDGREEVAARLLKEIGGRGLAEARYRKEIGK